MPELQELQWQRRNAIENARAIHKRAEAEGRELSAEEESNYQKAFAEQERLGREIKRLDDVRDLDRKMAELEAERTRPGGPRGGDGAAAHQVLEQMREFRGLWIADTYQNPLVKAGFRAPRGLVNDEQRGRLDAIVNRLYTYNSELRRSYMAWFKCFSTGEKELTLDERRDLNEYRDLLMGSDPAGGFTVPPEQFMATLLRKIDDYVYIRRLATKVMVVKAQDLGVPTLEDNPADADWTSELATGTADTVMDFGKRTFAPHPLAKQIRISKKLLRASALDLPELIADRFAYKFGITEEKAFLLGNGAGQPLGVFVASATGISTARDVNFANTATAISADNLRKVKYSLKAPYRANAQWIFHRDIVAQISLLKDSVGQYLWRDGIQMGDPDMLLGMPVNESEYAPNTMTTGQYIGILGDFSRYWIADSLDMTMQRLVELYAASNQEGFIMRQELDGMPVFEEAFVRVQLA